jgi:ABC-type transporter Mla maintaining outer membrane lipid asymmetry permease subunit MlaE
MLVTVLSNFLMIVLTMVASYFAAVVVVGVGSGRFLAGFFTRGTLVDVVGSEIETLAFGAIVAAICIERGLSARDGAEGVARAVRSSVLWSFLAVTVLDYLFTPTMLALFHDQLVLW